MTLFLTGLGGFFALHFFSALRSRNPEKDIRKRMGEARYMGLYSVLSLAFFIAMLVGYGRAPDGAPVWIGPDVARILALPLNVLALILLAAAYLPTGRIKRHVHHPMMAAVLIWAISHLLIGGDLPKLILLGAFAIYAVTSLLAAFRRGERISADPNWQGDLFAILAGLIATAALLSFGHVWITGVPPL